MSVLTSETIGNNLRLEYGFDTDQGDQVADLYLKAFALKLSRLLGTGPRAHRFLQASLDPSFAITVLHDAQVIGIAGYRTERGGLTDRFHTQMPVHYGRIGATWRSAMLNALERPEGSDKLLVDGIAVHPEWRGCGIGTKLLAAIDGRAAELGKHAVRLDVSDRNLRARALYARLGYVETDMHDLGLLRHAFGFRYATQMTKYL